ncbi:MAG: hypothetical protein Q8920_16410, partial [Bacillota bacterium]|nr:hypothetical protein [Bacillota bacterium]
TITARYKLSGKELVTSQSKIADNDGLVTWVWNIKKETTAGSYPITISGGGKSITSNYTVDK